MLKKRKVSELKDMICSLPAVSDAQKQTYNELRVKGDLVAEILKLRKGEAGTKSITSFFHKES